MSSKMFQRFLTLVLISCMLIQLFPMNLKAEQNSGNPEETTSEQTQLNENKDEVTNTETENTDEQVFPDPTVIPEPTDTQETLEPTASFDASVTPGTTEEPVEKQEPVEEPVEEEQELVENPEEVVEEQEPEESIEPIVEETEEPDIELVDDGITYLFFGSNYVKNESALTDILSRIETDAEYEVIDYVGLTGAFVMDSTDDVFTEVTIAHERLNSSTVDVLAGGSYEDAAGIQHKKSGLLYEDKRVVVYGVTADSIDNATSATGDAYAFSQWISGINDSKTLIVLAESELHAETNADNKAAKYWHDAFNAAAGKRDVIVVYGGTAKEYLSVGSEMKIHKESGDGIVDTTISYSYVHAGNLTEDHSSVIVGITDDEKAMIKYGLDQTESELLDIIKKPELQTFYGIDELDTACVEAYVTTTAKSMEYLSVWQEEGDDELIESLDEIFGYDRFSYSIDFDGYTEGTPIDISFSVPTEYIVDFINFEILHITQDGEVHPVEEYDILNEFIHFTVNAPGIFVFGIRCVEIPDDAVLESIEIVQKPFKQDYPWVKVIPGNLETYFSLKIDGLIVKATFVCPDGTVLEKSIDWKEQGNVEPLTEVDGYDLIFDRNKLGPQYVTVVYERNGVVKKAAFRITISYVDVTDEATGISFKFPETGITGFTVTKNTSEDFVMQAVEGLLTEYESYDITVKGHNEGDNVEITLPIPDKVVNPAVYYIHEGLCTAERINHVVSKEGYVTFTTNHFSTYVIGETGDFKPLSATVVREIKTNSVYKLDSNGLDSGKTYLIVNSNTAGNGVALKNNSNAPAAESVYVDNNTIELEDVAGLEWEVTGSSRYGWRFSNNGAYLRHQLDSWNDYVLYIGDNEDATWSYSNDRLYTYWITTEVYLKYIDKKWDLASGTSSGNVYFYEKIKQGSTEVANVTFEIDVTHNGQPETLITRKGVLKGDSLDLSSAFRTNNDQVTAPPTGGEYLWRNATTNGVATIDENCKTQKSCKVNFEGEAGQEVFEVSYKWSENGQDYIVSNYVVVEAFLPEFKIQISEDGKEPITAPVVVKNVYYGKEVPLYRIITDIENKVVAEADIIKKDKITWASEDENLATVDQNGVVTLKGVSGVVRITVYYDYLDGKKIATDTIVLSLSTSDAITPEDGTNDFPEYPNEGAIRFDKHAQAVGSFLKTGVVQVELSMTGVPYTTNNEIDVVIMMDMSSSMDDVTDRVKYSVEAAQNALEKLVTNEDGTLNKNRVAIYGFNGWRSSSYNDYIQAVYENYPSQTGIDTYSGNNNPNIELISSMTEYTAETLKDAKTAISSQYQNLGDGTNYAAALRQCYLTLKETKQEGRPQYVIFMTDGFASTGFAYVNNNNQCAILNNSNLGNNGTTGLGNNGAQTRTEYYSKLMKEAGVEIYTVGMQVGSGSGLSNYKAAGQTVLKKIAGKQDGDATSKYTDHAIFIDKESDTSKIVDAFDHIAESIKQAATNVLVTDKIADEYTMIFDIPHDDIESDFPENQEFFIEVVDYALDPVKKDGVIVDYVRGEAETLSKIYIKSDNQGVYAAKNNAGDRFESLQFVPVTNNANEEQFGYWKKVSSTEAYDVQVGSDYYKFMPNGDGTHNIDSGAYATTTVVNGEDKLKIISPYFIYDEATHIIQWTSQKLSSSELALRYFLYLEKSAGWEKEDDKTPPGTYETNDYATIRYKNHLEKTCEQVFPVPKMTWNGAQVSYVFYLVNEQGQPVNRAGRVVPFSEATYVTDVFTTSITWNDTDETEVFESRILAEGLLPDVYSLFDPAAVYQIHVFENEAGMNLNNHFRIEGGVIKQTANGQKQINTTYVFNSKSDINKYNEPGIYAANSTFLCKNYEGVKYENGVYSYDQSVSGLKQFVDTKDGKNTTIFGVDAVGHYTICYKTGANDVETGFDFANTTVAFGVLWDLSLKEDVVVIDYGLPVDIDVTNNDGVLSSVVGVLKNPVADTEINVGVYNPETHNSSVELESGTATVVGTSLVQYKPNDMLMNNEDVFYYEAEITHYDSDGNIVTENMYSSVTVIPATSIYYEDSFVEFSGYSSTMQENGIPIFGTTPDPSVKWSNVGEVISNAKQQSDRPGPDKIGTLYDADNVYGYDDAYKECSTYSLGSAKMFTANLTQYGTASFEFFGTGFDVISLTSNKTGTILVDVYPVGNGSVGDGANPINTYIVDTYYGYKYNAETDTWSPDTSGADNSLYQIPVISVEGLEYGKYKAVISVIYSPNFDHTGPAGYDFYLDAIRIFDPAGNVESKDTIKDAYIADGEYKPAYHELRNQIIKASEFIKLNNKVAQGVVFVDGIPSVSLNSSSGEESTSPYSITDYKNFGPNNEVYLAANQVVSFDLNATFTNLPHLIDINSSLYDIKVQIGLKAVSQSGASYKIVGVGDNDDVTNKIKSAPVTTLTSSTEMYYDITDLNGKTVVIQNTSGMLSITNVKITLGAKENASAASFKREMSKAIAFVTPLVVADAEEELLLFTVNPVMTRKVLWALNGGRHSSFVEAPSDDLKLPLGPEAPEDELVEVIDLTDLAVDPGDLPEIAEKREESIFEQLKPEDFFEQFNVFDAQQDNIFMRILSFIANFFAEFVLWLKQLLGF